MENDITEKPKTATNWRGIQEEIPWPKGHIVLRCGDVYLIRQKKEKFAIVYGLQVSEGLDYSQAARQLGESCLHQAGC